MPLEPMTPKQRMSAMLLAELKSDLPREWYYVSMVDREGFRGGIFLYAHGPTDAHMMSHNLGLFIVGCASQTHGPCDYEMMQTVPHDKLWRVLTKEEVQSLKFNDTNKADKEISP